MDIHRFKDIPIYENNILDMKNCKQNDLQTIFDHGLSVLLHQQDLIDYIIKDNILNYKWNLPKWFDKNFINLSKKILLNSKLGKIRTYAFYHDCGKPYCFSLDENKKPHFVNHEHISYNKWMELNGDEFIGDLIKYDMVLHKSSPKDVTNIFKNLSEEKWIILIITSLSELHANSTMFGGIEHINFKIKLKKFSKNVCKLLKCFN